MSTNIDDQNPKKPGNGKIFVGLLLLVLGIGYLLQQLNFAFMPGWLFSWPAAMIIWGLYIGAKYNFRNSAWLIITLVGVVWMSNEAFPDYNVYGIAWPIAIIIFGIWLITRRNHSWDKNSWGGKWENKWEKVENKWERKWGGDKYSSDNPFEPVVKPVTPVEPADADGPTVMSSSGSTTIPPAGNTGNTGNANNPFAGPFSADDYLDAVSVFGGVKKTILSKNFRGGEIVNIFGGAELDFTQADINGRVVIDITQIFGGTKIIVPSNWQVVSDLAAVFAGIDDKRIRTTAGTDTTKVLVLKGVSIFAGVDIRSY